MVTGPLLLHLVLRYGTGVYESNTLFTLACIKYGSYQQTVRKKKFSLWHALKIGHINKQ